MTGQRNPVPHPPGRAAAVFLAAVALLAMGVAAQTLTIDGPGEVIRGDHFVTRIMGIPVTDYYLWVTGSSSMSGSPGDQPPVLLAGQEGVARDPAGGPYAIGSHVTAGGATIRGDVPKSPSGGTGYYALVTTDVGGFRTVEWATSQDTGTGQYDIRVERGAPANREYDETSVRVTRGSLTLEVSGETVPATSARQTVQVTTTAAPPPQPVTGTPTTMAVTPIPATPATTPAPLPSPSPTPAPGFEGGVALAGVAGAGFVMIRGRRR